MWKSAECVFPLEDFPPIENMGHQKDWLWDRWIWSRQVNLDCQHSWSCLGYRSMCNIGQKFRLMLCGGHGTLTNEVRTAAISVGAMPFKSRPNTFVKKGSDVSDIGEVILFRLDEVLFKPITDAITPWTCGMEVGVDVGTTARNIWDTTGAIAVPVIEPFEKDPYKNLAAWLAPAISVIREGMACEVEVASSWTDGCPSWAGLARAIGIKEIRSMARILARYRKDAGWEKCKHCTGYWISTPNPRKLRLYWDLITCQRKVCQKDAGFGHTDMSWWSSWSCETSKRQ